MKDFKINSSTTIPKYKRIKKSIVYTLFGLIFGSTALMTSCIGATAGDPAFSPSSEGSTLSSSHDSVSS